MLRIVIPGADLYDEQSNTFTYSKAQTLQLEHSLISISRWESKWHKPFLATEDKTNEETLDYIRCMTMGQGVDPSVYYSIPPRVFKEIDAYINDKQTATRFSERGGRPNREIVTSEIIYYWMISYQIPLECEKWHLNRLLTLIKVCNIKNAPGKKMSKQEILRQNRALNASRRQRMGTSG